MGKKLKADRGKSHLEKRRGTVKKRESHGGRRTTNKKKSSPGLQKGWAGCYDGDGTKWRQGVSNKTGK